MDPPTFACGMCGKCFLDAEQVRLHIQTHTGQQPFRCIVCWPLFYDMSSTETPQPCVPAKPVTTPATAATAAVVPPREALTSQVTDRQEDVPVKAASSVLAAAVETQEVTVTPPPQHPYLASQSSGGASADVQDDSSLQTQTQDSQEKRDGVDDEMQSEPGMSFGDRELSSKDSGPPDLVAESDIAVGSISEDHSELKPQVLGQEKGEGVMDEFNSDPVMAFSVDEVNNDRAMASSDKELLVKNNEPPNLVAENYIAVHHSPEDCSELETKVDVVVNLMNSAGCESHSESVMISVDQDILKNVPPKETLADGHQKELSESLERDLPQTTDIPVTPDQNGHTVANKIGLHAVDSVLTEDVTDAVAIGAAILKKDTLAKLHENDVSSPQKNGTVETKQNKVNISTLFPEENMLTPAPQKYILAPSAEVTVENPVQSVVPSAEVIDKNPVQSVPPSAEVTVENPVQSVPPSAEVTVENPVQSVVPSAEFTDKNPVQSVVPSAEITDKNPDQGDTSTETPQIKQASSMQDGHWGQMTSKQSVIVDAHNKTQADERLNYSNKSADCPRPSTSTAGTMIESVYTSTSDMEWSQTSYFVCRSKDSACTSVPETVKRKPLHKKTRPNLPCMNVVEIDNLSRIQFSLEELIACADFSVDCHLTKALTDSIFKNRFCNREQNKTSLSQNFSCSTAGDLMTSSSEMYMCSNTDGGRRKKGKPKKLSVEKLLPPFLTERLCQEAATHDHVEKLLPPFLTERLCQEAATHDHGTYQWKNDEPEFVAPDPSEPLICSATHSKPDHSEPEGRHQNTNSKQQGDNQRHSDLQAVMEKQPDSHDTCRVKNTAQCQTQGDNQRHSDLQAVMEKQPDSHDTCRVKNTAQCQTQGATQEWMEKECSEKRDSTLDEANVTNTSKTPGTQEMNEKEKPVERGCELDEDRLNKTGVDFQGVISFLKNVQLRGSVDLQNTEENNKTCDKESQRAEYQPDICKSSKSDVVITASTLKESHSTSGEMQQTGSKSQTVVTGETVTVKENVTVSDVTSGVPSESQTISDRNHPSTVDRQAPDSSVENTDSIRSEVTFSASSKSKLKGLSVSLPRIPDSMLKTLLTGKTINQLDVSVGKYPQHQSSSGAKFDDVFSSSAQHVNSHSSEHIHEHEIPGQEVDDDEGSLSQMWEHSNTNCTMPSQQAPLSGVAGLPTSAHSDMEQSSDHEDADHSVLATFVSPKNTMEIGRTQQGMNKESLQGIEDVGVKVKTASVADRSADDGYTEEGKKSVSAGIPESGSQVLIRCSKNQTLGSTEKRRGKSLKRVLKTNETRQVKRSRMSAKKQMVALKEAGSDHQKVTSSQQKERSAQHDSVNKVKSKLAAPSNTNCSTEAGLNEKENSQDMNMECDHSALEDNASKVTDLPAVGGQIRELSIVMVRHEPDGIRKSLTPERRMSEESVEIVDLPQIIKPRRVRQKQTSKGYYWRSRHVETCDILTKGGQEKDSIAALGISAYHDESLISTPSCKDVLEARINGTIPGSLSTQQNSPQSPCDAMTSADCGQNQAQNEQTVPYFDQNQAQNEQTVPYFDQNQAQNEQTLPYFDQNQTQNEQTLPYFDQNQAQNEQTLRSGEKQTEFGQEKDTCGGQIIGTGLVSSETQVLSPPAETFTPSVAESAKQAAARRKATLQAQINAEAMKNNSDEGSSESTNILLEIHDTINSQTQSKQEKDARRKVSFKTAGEKMKAPDCSNSVPIQGKQKDNPSGARKEPEISDDSELISVETDNAACEQPVYRSCGDCGATFRKYMNYVFHLASGCKKRFVCHICGSSMGRGETLKNHMRTHTDESAVSGKRLSGQHSLDNHMRTHTEESAVSGKRLSGQHSLDNHMRIHTGKKPYKCPSCPKSFRQPADLTSHSRIHSMEHPFQCNICFKAYRFANSLTSHRLTHLGEPSYACYVCSAAFFQVGALKDHLKVHSDERPFACSVCLMRFKERAELTEHEYQNHTKESSEVKQKKAKEVVKRHTCSLCGRRFSCAFSLRRHMKGFCYMLDKKSRVQAE